jgi:hypothetical protein
MVILIDSFYLRSASELFQIVRVATEDPSGPLKASTEPLTILALSFADEEGYNFAINASIRRLDEEEASSRCQLMAKVSMCWVARDSGNGDFYAFLGIRTVHKIQYLHRTVKDYLHQPDTWRTLLSHTAGTPLSPHTALLKSCILQLKHLDSAQRFDSLWRIASTAMFHARYSDSEESAPLEALLDELDKTIAFHGNISTMGMRGHWAEHNQTAAWKNSFLSLAVQYGLCNYLDMKLSKDSSPLRRKSGRPLLDYAVNPMDYTTDFVGPSITAILLQHGADPNGKVGRQSIWEAFLSRQCSLKRGKDTMRERLATFELLPGFCEKHKCPHSATHVLPTTLKPSSQAQIEDLNKLLKKKYSYSYSFFQSFSQWAWFEYGYSFLWTEWQNYDILTSGEGDEDAPLRFELVGS